MANPPRTHLRHEEPGLLVDTSDREWHTELVIEVACCRHGRTGTLEHLRQQVLGRGLADRAGDADDLKTRSACAVDQISGEPAERDERVHHDQAQCARHRMPGQRRGRAGGCGRGNVIMAIDMLSRQRDKQGTRPRPPGSRLSGQSPPQSGRRDQTSWAPSTVAISSTVTAITASRPAGRRRQIRMQHGPLLRCHHRIAEWQDRSGDFLTELMAFAENRDHITRSRQLQGEADRRAPVAAVDDLCCQTLSAHRSARPADQLCPNGGRVFGPWIVVGGDHDIRVSRRRLAHRLVASADHGRHHSQRTTMRRRLPTASNAAAIAWGVCAKST